MEASNTQEPLEVHLKETAGHSEFRKAVWGILGLVGLIGLLYDFSYKADPKHGWLWTVAIVGAAVLVITLNKLALSIYMRYSRDD